MLFVVEGVDIGGVFETGRVAGGGGEDCLVIGGVIDFPKRRSFC